MAAQPGAAAQAQAQAIAAGLQQHDDVRRSTQLPIFRGFNKDNTVSANILADRVEAAAHVGNWGDARKCRELFLILRDEALLWWESLRHIDNLDRDEDWPLVKERLLKTYAPKFTARTNCLNLLKLSQGPAEKVQTYFLRLDETFKRMSESRPANIHDVRVPPLAANQDNARDQRIKLEGLKDQEKFFLTQMFIAGLRENLRSKVMEENVNNLMDLVDLAVEKETIFSHDNKPQTLPIFAIDLNEPTESNPNDIDNDLDEEELEVINAIRRSRNLPPFKKRNGGYTGQLGPCRFCKANGHSQKFCRKRIEAKAPCVDASGQPYALQPRIASFQEQSYYHNQGYPSQQQQSQQQQPQPIPQPPQEQFNQDFDFNRISALGAHHLNY